MHAPYSFSAAVGSDFHFSMNRPPHPALSPSEGERVPEGRVRGRFMVPMHAQKRKEALHEPTHPWPLPGGELGKRARHCSPPPEGLGVGSWPQLTSNFLEVFALREPASPPVQSFVAYATKVRRDPCVVRMR